MVRLATYNIRHGRGLDGIVDVARVARAITETGAAFVALQEVDRNRARSGGIDQPALLAEMTGLEVGFWPTLTHGNGEYGLAAAASETYEADFHPLPRSASEEPRGAIVARWRGITLVAVHLATESGPRRLQIEALAELSTEVTPPTVILGDLNSPRRGLDPLFDAGFDPGPRLKTRGSVRLPQIDYILPGPGLALEAAWTLPTTASDHVPVVAEVTTTS